MLAPARSGCPRLGHMTALRWKDPLDLPVGGLAGARRSAGDEPSRGADRGPGRPAL